MIGPYICYNTPFISKDKLARDFSGALTENNNIFTFILAPALTSGPSHLYTNIHLRNGTRLALKSFV